MKTISLRKILSKAILALAIFSGLEVKAQSTVNFSKPGFSMNYIHNGTNWLHKTNSTFTYNPDGLVLEELQQDPVTNQNKYKFVKKYDSFGNQIAESDFDWQNSAWNFNYGWRDSIVYFSGNKKSYVISTVWINNNWENYGRMNYTYDTNNFLTEEAQADWDATTLAWIPYNKTTYNNDANGVITQKQYFNFQNGNWNLTKTESNYTWHIPNILPATYNSTTPNGLYPHRVTVTQGANGGKTTVEEYFYTPTSTWRNFRRETETFDFRGNFINLLMENANAGPWAVISEHQEVLTYNSIFDITEKIIRYPDMGPQNGGPVKDRTKYVYSNFQYFTRVLGKSELQKTSLTFNIYPNPATDKVQIQLAESKPQALTATVTDITGKIWQTKIFKTGQETSLNIEELPKGVYLLKLESERGSVIKKIVKQ